MGVQIDGRGRELIEAPNLGFVGSLLDDGTPAVNPAWVDLDGNALLLNSNTGRTWPRRLERNPRVSVTVANRENVVEYVEVRGHLVDTTTDGANEHIRQLSQKYTGSPEYPLQPGEQRVILRIEPDSVHHHEG